MTVFSDLFAVIRVRFSVVFRASVFACVRVSRVRVFVLARLSLFLSRAFSSRFS